MSSKLLIIAVVLIFLGGLGVAFISRAPTETENATTTSTTAQAIEIKNFAFSPATLTIRAGTAVRWTNADSMQHSATAEDKSFDTGLLAQGESKTITFSKVGTFSYICSLHPNMHGVIIVTP